MESLSLFKYWRGGPGCTPAARMRTATAATLSELSSPMQEVDVEEREDEGPFFDLEFTVPHARGAESGGGEGNEASNGGEDDKDFNFSMASEESEFRSMSSDDDLFFKGRLLPLEASSIVITDPETDPKTQLAVSLLKSATRFRVFILGLRKPKPSATELNAAGASPKHCQPANKFFFVKFKVEEVPIVSLFTRDGSSRNLAGGAKTLPKPTDTEGDNETACGEVAPPASEDKKSNSKEVVHKYFNKIKPLYIRVSKRYADKQRFPDPFPNHTLPASGEKETEADEPGTAKIAIAEKTHKIPMPAMLRVVCERLGKSRSASVEAGSMSCQQRRDDSLLQQQDGIQSAIAHCKRSFTASSKGTGSSLLRSKSDPAMKPAQEQPTFSS